MTDPDGAATGHPPRRYVGFVVGLVGFIAMVTTPAPATLGDSG